MGYILVAIILIAIILIVLSLRHKRRKNKVGKYEKVFLYDTRGFYPNYIHRNGTKFDDYGYDYFGYDVNGYNKDGYNRLGKNNSG